MRVADSHEFLELYRGDKDIRLGMEMLKLRDDLRFASFAPDRLSPTDRARFGASKLAEVGLPDMPERMELRLLRSVSLRFARKESGGIVSFMPAYPCALWKWRPDVILENPYSWLTLRSYQTYAVSRFLHIPVVYHDPGDDIPVGKKHRIMAHWESPVVRRASAIITFNDAGARRFVDKYGYPAERIRVIPKPVDVSRFASAAGRRAEVRARWGLEQTDLAVGYVGRLAEYKGSSYLLETARMALSDAGLSRLRFVFVGDTLSSNEARTDYELPNCRVTGMIPNTEVPEALAALDVVVFPDLTHPGAFPTAVAEAMGAGKTIIAGVGAASRFVPLRHRRDALLVGAQSPAEILEALRSLVADRELARSLGTAVGERARTTMDYPVVAAQWLETLEAVTS